MTVPPHPPTKGCIAAAHPQAVQAGLQILAAGGNAFDAAAAVAAALNVVEPQMSGLAGMGLATCHIAAEGRVRTLDFIPPVNRGFHLAPGQSRLDLVRGGAGAGLPTALAGWARLVAAHGRLGLAEVLAPAITLAEQGFRLLNLGAFCINETDAQLAEYPDLQPEWRRVYLPGGRPVAPGDLLTQPDLAETLAAIARHGPGHLYLGPLGKRIAARIQEAGGSIDAAELAAISPQWQDTASIDYRGWRVHVSPPPSQGFQILLALGLLAAGPAPEAETAESLDRVLRAIRLAAGQRIALDNPSRTELDRLLSPEGLAPLIRRLDAAGPIRGPVESGDGIVIGGARKAAENTTSFSVGDAEGNLVCITQSLGQFFGSGIVVPGTGICLNDMPAFGDLSPGSRSFMRPGGPFVQPMAPVIVTRDGAPRLAIGTPGSFGILQSTVQALVRILDLGQPLQEAIAAPRIRLWDGARIEAEARFGDAVLARLTALGHEVTAGPDWTTKVGGIHAVALDPATDGFAGAYDPRRDGTAATSQ